MLSSNWFDQPFADGDGSRFALIEGRVYFPDASHTGWFDYASTIVGINEVYDPDANPERRRWTTAFPLSQIAIVHEKFHMLQAVAFPYFWRWCLVWRRLTVEACHHMLTESSNIRDALRDLPAVLPRSLKDEIRGHLGALTTQGAYGLSALQLLEAHATLGEIWALARQDSVMDVCAELDRNSPNAGYRLAFDVVRLAVGDDVALEVFAPLVAAAFCFDVPVQAFELILELVASLPIEDRTTVTIEGLCRATAGTELAPHFFGLPGEQAQQLTKFSSIPHGVNCSRLLTACADHGININDLLADRHLIAAGAAVVDPTILYAPDEDAYAAVFPGIYLKGFDGGIDSPEYRAYRLERFLMVVSQRLLRDGEAQAAADVPPEHSWLSFVSEERLPIRIFLPLVTATPREIAERLAADMSIRELRAPVTHASKGNSYLAHGVLEFVIESPLEVWQDPRARAIVRALSDICPEFPLFLRPDQNAIAVWFGCLTDIDGVTAAGFDVVHPSARHEIARFIEAVEQCVHATGLDFFPLADRMLAPIRALR